MTIYTTGDTHAAGRSSMCAAARSTKILEIFAGANELQQWIVARRLIGRDITG